MKRKRSGNLLLTVIVFVMLAMVISGLIPATLATRRSAQEKASHAGDVTSYITLTNVCAAAFKEDLECQFVEMVVADIVNPDGLDEEIPFETFQRAITFLQNGSAGGIPGYSVSPGLKRDDGEEAGEWYHYLTDPRLALEYDGITDAKVLELANRLLDDATVSVKIMEPLSVMPTREQNEAQIEDIYIQVILEKGTTKVTQDYRLTGEMLKGRPNESMAYIQVSGEDADLIMEGQTVSRRNIS